MDGKKKNLNGWGLCARVHVSVLVIRVGLEAPKLTLRVHVCVCRFIAVVLRFGGGGKGRADARGRWETETDTFFSLF